MGDYRRNGAPPLKKHICLCGREIHVTLTHLCCWDVKRGSLREEEEEEDESLASIGVRPYLTNNASIMHAGRTTIGGSIISLMEIS